MARKLTNNFWDYEMGAEMKTTVDAWNNALDNNYRTDAFAMQQKWEAFQISFRYLFGMNVNFTRTDEYYGICDDNEHFFYRVER